VTDWETEGFPVLAAAYRVTTRDPENPYLSQTELNAELGREPNDPRTWRTTSELLDDDWLDVVGNDQFVFERPSFPCRIVLGGKARELLAGWPSSGTEALYERFIAALDESIAAAPNDEERGKLERLRADAGDIGKGVLIGVLSNIHRIYGVPI
jgi:hypothetical protein